MSLATAKAKEIIGNIPYGRSAKLDSIRGNNNNNNK
jgi:hypothetical protein